MPELDRLRDSVADLLPAYLDDLAELVAVDSGTHDADGVNRVADLVAARLEKVGCSVERIAGAGGHIGDVGDVVVARLHGSGRTSVLLLAHLDTVFDDGAAAQRPFTIAPDGRATGPGVADDKAGLLAAVYALQALVETGVARPGEIVVCLSPDEETGSGTARPHIERLAGQVDAVLSLECAREDGAVVDARKGVADVRVVIHGRAAHAGIEPERGLDAALAAADLVIALREIPRRHEGVHLNVGLIHAGTRVNVVCERAEIGLEVRAVTQADLDDALGAVEAGVADVCGGTFTASTRVSGQCPPWPRDERSAPLCELAGNVAGELGFSLRAVATGGVADANYAAATGTPTLDGLGPVGGDDHSSDEWLDTHSIVERVALLAGMLNRMAEHSSGRSA